ncbi:hypothetical protein RVR_5387 [Actinacidiphila reveromycinica]|uniref:DUF4232 domain-containing protein n=1 Tax=Actinacidiphila reveromycinica TaxID=659352 RepID=A0A7U3UUG8_9ACTN|nr:DUF4232 domain-containing protein [Streptomyces sp. SN-593]BBA98966.1 hypothetical protein RVR_5387 [Streptomyces sp. SN-593]
MRIRKISIVALVAVAASLSLTACNDDDSDGASGAATSTTAGAPLDGSGSSGSAGSTGSGGSDGANGSSGANGTGTSATSASGGSSGSDGSGTADAGAVACTTANLAFSVSGGMGEGELLVNLTNTAGYSCTMHGFPGVDLKGGAGTQSAARSSLSAPDVTLHSGEQTRFTLHYPPNTSGGSGATFTTLIVTPPNETHAHTLPVSINVPVTDGSGPGITVDPVGVGK